MQDALESNVRIRREGGCVVVARDARWPDRCVRCNAPAHGFRKAQRLYWHPTWVYATIFLGPLFYIVFALVYRLKMRVEPGLCPRHRVRRTRLLVAAWALVPVTVLGGVALSVHPLLMFFGPIAALLIAAVLGVAASNIVRVKRIEGPHAWVRCGQAFVTSLPMPGESGPLLAAD